MSLYFRTTEKIEELHEALQAYEKKLREGQEWAKEEFGEDTKVVTSNDRIVAVTGDAEEYDYMCDSDRVPGTQTMKPHGSYNKGKEIKKQMKAHSPERLRKIMADIGGVPERVFTGGRMYQLGFSQGPEKKTWYLSMSEAVYDEIEDDIPDFWNPIAYQDLPDGVFG